MIAICGEALVDLVPADAAGQRFDARPGGSCANTAVALARLGTPVTMLARLSTDRFGQQLRRHLEANGVQLSRAVAADQPSSVAVATTASDGSATYRFLIDGTADWQWTDAELGELPADVAAVHSGSLATTVPPGADAVVRWLERCRDHCTVSFDPNVRADLVADLPAHRTRVEHCVTLADLVKVSADDLAVLYPDRDPGDVAAVWLRSGPSLVVVTDGGAGSTAFTAAGQLRCPAVTVSVADTIGAGDTFTAGLLDWLARAGRLGGRLPAFDRDALRAALRAAGRAAAVTCSRPGADPPYRRELEPAGPPRSSSS